MRPFGVQLLLSGNKMMALDCCEGALSIASMGAFMVEDNAGPILLSEPPKDGVEYELYQYDGSTETNNGSVPWVGHGPAQKVTIDDLLQKIL